jgi:hypothetical protein
MSEFGKGTRQYVERRRGSVRHRNPERFEHDLIGFAEDDHCRGQQNEKREGYPLHDRTTRRRQPDHVTGSRRACRTRLRLPAKPLS